MRRAILLIAMLLAFPAAAQTTPEAAPTRTIHLTDRQIEEIVNVGAACLEKVPYACARYAVFINDLLMKAVAK